ncbi:phosphatase PAP2 family protein [Pseudoduganella sp. GCM10020061]|uniref:phosphatase PAP2 family protein n=1 Tax=Pseudoduganella sp. GCM10020061 TaxID=3317345 RepID=UPI003638A946
MFENINHSLFSLMHAGPGLHGPRLMLAVAAAEWLIMLVPTMLALMWLRGTPEVRAVAMRAALAVAFALLANGIVALVWFSQRPFVVGLAENILQHDGDSSFPSDHATIMFTMAFVLLSSVHTRALGLWMLLAALATAWARVYVGVHFPLDMAGALLMALGVAALSTQPQARGAVKAVLALTIPVYQRLFSLAIRRGWARP